MSLTVVDDVLRDEALKDTLPPDFQECLVGIRKEYFESSSMEEEELDPETTKRIAQVEADLVALLQPKDPINHAQDCIAKFKQGLPTSISLELLALHSKHAFPCSDTNKVLPSPPSQWPQAPLMIRPTPHTSTKIRGIRRAGSLEYEHFAGFCAGCILPINCGTELPGESLVIDFESTHFVGTLLMRIQQAKCLDKDQTHHSTQSYFDGKKRKFQAVIKGRFQTPLPMNETVTGQTFHRPAGNLPARWIVTSFIKFISTLAPQLEVTLDGSAPRFLTPLVATAHTVLQRPITSILSKNLEEEMEELPFSDPASVVSLAHQALGISSPTDTSLISTSARMKARKRAFNQLAGKKDNSLKFDTTKEYTFEFYQHLLDFGDEGLAVNMGRPIGKVGLSRALDGQPLKFMSAHQHPSTGELDTLWSFDIWHATLYPYAVSASSHLA